MAAWTQTLRSFTAKADKDVRIPSHKIPIIKLKLSATTPRRSGTIPDPNTVPKEPTKPTAIARSGTEVTFEIAARPTGKKHTERVACRIRAIEICVSVEEKERATVANPVARTVTFSILVYP